MGFFLKSANFYFKPISSLCVIYGGAHLRQIQVIGDLALTLIW